MKSILAWLLALAATLSLTACAAPPAPTVPTETAALTEPETEPVTEPETEAPTEAPTEPETEPTVPLLAQQDYPGPYAGTTVPRGGCGITCVAMVLSYYQGEILSPSELAVTYDRFGCVAGTDWKLFPTVAEDYNLNFCQTFRHQEVLDALAQGIPVICNVGRSLFTNGGHFILLTGLTEDGKILVNDPNRDNWEKKSLADGFENGFSPDDIIPNAICYWIYTLPEETAH